jgi:molecular chaperone IbpA
MHINEPYSKLPKAEIVYKVHPLVEQLNLRGIGFNNHFAFLEEVMKQNTTYPPFDIVEVDTNTYEIQLAVAGFNKKEISISFQDQVVTIEGKKDITPDLKYLHKGIGARSFKHAFPVAEYVRVDDAQLEDGILTVKLSRELPEELKPQTIKIK